MVGIFLPMSETYNDPNSNLAPQNSEDRLARIGSASNVGECDNAEDHATLLLNREEANRELAHHNDGTSPHLWG